MYSFLALLSAESLTPAALTTTTKSPTSMCRAYVGLCLPLRMCATCVANRPRTAPWASTSHHRRSMVVGVGENVFTEAFQQGDRGRDARPARSRQTVIIAIMPPMDALTAAADILGSDELSSICEMVVHRDDGWIVARAHDGLVRFRAVPDGNGGWDTEVGAIEGRNPLGRQETDVFASLEEEKAGLFPAGEANSFPHAYESLAQVFTHPDAPDLAAVHTAAHNWEDQGGHKGEHGSLDVIQ